MHLNNWALLIDGNRVALSPCYDFVSSRILFPDEPDSALAINGRKDRLERSDFDALVSALQIDPKAAANSFEKLRGARETLRRMASECELSDKLRHDLENVIVTRHQRLFEGPRPPRRSGHPGRS